MPEFCHLHCHTQYSLLDGAARIKKLVGRAAELEIPALAITDHGNLFGVPEFYTYAQAGGRPAHHRLRVLRHAERDGRHERPHALPPGPAREERGGLPQPHQALVAELHRRLLLQAAHRPRHAPRATAKGSSRRRAASRARCCRRSSSRARRRAARCSRSTSTSSARTTTSRSRTTASPSSGSATPCSLRWAEQFGVKVVATNDVHYVEQDDAAGAGRAPLPPDRQATSTTRTGCGSRTTSSSSSRRRRCRPRSCRAPRGRVRATVVDRGARHDARDRGQVQAGAARWATLLMPHFPIPRRVRAARRVPPRTSSTRARRPATARGPQRDHPRAARLRAGASSRRWASTATSSSCRTSRRRPATSA